MWATVRRRILCLPAPDPVCGDGGHHRVLFGGAKSSTEAKKQCEFSSWLTSRGEHDANTGVRIGLSPYGRALFATRPIHAGECMLQVSRDLMITPDKLPEAVLKLLSKDASAWAMLALFLLAHQHIKEASPWAPYIDCLPPLDSLQSTVFWKKEELAYLKASSLYRETLERKEVVKREYAAVQKALLLCPHIFGDRVSEREFIHAYAIVCSRAWGIQTLKTLALVPFVDFFNHDANCRSLLSFDEEKQCAEVVSDRDYATGDQVIISYGKLSNATLALDFGFALPSNPHDEAEIWLALSRDDPLFESKLKLLHTHNMPTLMGSNGVDTAGNTFTIKALKAPPGRGGIPLSLRAFARVACASSSHELEEMAKAAAASDGRLARKPSNDKSKELKAMTLLQTLVDKRIEKLEAASLAIEKNTSVFQKPRKDIALRIVSGELRVLESASTWLKTQALVET